MTGSLVIDASVGFAWVYPDQATLGTDALLQDVAAGATVVVPSLWFLEMANVLLVAQRRRRLTSAQRKEALARLTALQFVADDEATHHAFGKISELAEERGLSVYDATYLELAVRRDLALASRDEQLRTAAKQCGVALLGKAGD